ncbi:MAG: hypothetical protein K6D96_06660 [Acetatifactor sp.]|nr:hypothetical protein [Acetatifactor sp.]
METRTRKYRDDSMIKAMTYEEWKKTRWNETNSITRPEEESWECTSRKGSDDYPTKEGRLY